MNKKVLCWIAGAVALLLLPQSLVAAENVLLSLKARGVDIRGDVLPPNPYAGAIECFAYEQAVAVSVQAASGMATGRRQYEPITIRKKIDKATPLIAKALTENAPVDAVFRFFRKGADGRLANIYTVEIRDGRITARKDVVESTLDAATARMPEYEEVSFSINTIKWRWMDGGIEASDDLTGKR